MRQRKRVVEEGGHTHEIYREIKFEMWEGRMMVGEEIMVTTHEILIDDEKLALTHFFF
jgi:hypothetical protein